MVTRREAAQRLDITLEMAHRHGIPATVSESELAAIETAPPAWLVQSRANRTGRRPVWVTLTCVVCGRSETVRPKKWWQEFGLVACDDHDPDALPPVPEGMLRSEYDGVGNHFTGFVDVGLETPTAHG
ncbi:MAG: hypothetical protein RI885_1358 [Actinomycetota bacterium]|jgi:hypothetical protein